jgi:hypothetical protein
MITETWLKVIAKTDCKLAMMECKNFLFAVQQTLMFALEIMHSYSNRIRCLREMGTLLERVSQFDRETLVAILSQREDISEEEANQIVDRIVSVRDSIQEQFQQIQQKMQSILDSIFGKVRDYLNSLECPELNYEGIKQDFSQVFDDPKAGFEVLRDRLFVAVSY